MRYSSTTAMLRTRGAVDPFLAAATGSGNLLNTVFSTTFEVHAFLFGALAGIVVASLAIRRGPELSMVFALGMVLFTFGILSADGLCSGGPGCRHVRAKPWYFLGGFLALHSFSMGVLQRVSLTTADTDQQLPVQSLLIALFSLVLLSLGLLSFFTPSVPVRPISGLSTLGGLLGGPLALMTFEHIRGKVGLGLSETVRRCLGYGLDQVVLAVGYGTVVGFAYPSLAWNSGYVLGISGGYPLGRPIWPLSGLVTTVAYVAVFFLASVALARLRSPDTESPDVRAILYAHATYVVCLFLATGLAGPLWFRALPVS